MRFDLEIPQANIDICIISEGADIPNISAPLYYVNINTDNKVPADFITADIMYSPDEYSIGGYEIKNGPYLDDVKASNFLLTDISKYSFKNNTKIPLFYRHFIPAIIKEDAISIVDHYGVSISRDDFTIEYEDSGTYVYMNKTNDLLFVQYIIDNATNKVLLNLNKVFSEASWSDISQSGILPKHRYIYRDGAVDTSYNGELYISYTNNTQLFRKPLGNIDDPWFVSILNCDLVIDNNKYTIPEYYMQQLNSDGKYKFIEFKKCIKVFDRYVKSQYNIFDRYFDDISIYIQDSISQKVRYAFTFNKTKIGSLYKDNIFYGELKFYNNDGMIEVPVQLLDTDIVYTSHYTQEDYYEYNILDMNSIEQNDGGFYAIYMKPNVKDGRSVFHAKIGSLEFQGSDINFNTFDDYMGYINFYSYYHVASINPSYENEDFDLIDIRDQEVIEIDNKDIAGISVDMVYSDIINGNLNIPTNDSVLVSIDLSRLQKEGKINTDIDDVIDKDGVSYIEVFEKNIKRTLNASTKTIYEIIRQVRVV